VIASLDRVPRSDGRIWIYDLRPVAARDVQAAASEVSRRVDRTLLRTACSLRHSSSVSRLFAAASAQDQSS
jgi:hypothetical protein